jgi:hypothetical protein
VDSSSFLTTRIRHYVVCLYVIQILKLMEDIKGILKLFSLGISIIVLSWTRLYRTIMVGISILVMWRGYVTSGGPQQHICYSALLSILRTQLIFTL